jgi:hypothetical protein
LKTALPHLEQAQKLYFGMKEAWMLLIGVIEILKLLLLSFILGVHIIAINNFPVVLLLFPPKD